MTLRPYQRAAIDSLYHYWAQGKRDPSLIVAPTGAGKSVIIAHLIKELREDYPDTRVLLLTHVKELIAQNYSKLLAAWPEAPAGIYSAGLNRRDIQAPVLFAGIQSIDKHADKLDPPPELVIIDEAHLIPRTSTTRYQRTLGLLKAMYPALQVVGLTATPFRLDSGWLHLGEDALFSEIVYDIPIQHLIDEGYLSPVTMKAGKVSIDTSQVHTRGGEFVPGELERAAMSGNTTAAAVADMCDRARDRNKWLVFAAGIKHAHQVGEALQGRGISTGVVTGKLSKADRDGIIHQFRTGALRAIVNVNVLTTGFDVPTVDMVAMLRPTGSAGLYVQIVGRGMRIAPGKADCLVLDYAENVMRHGPIDDIRINQPGGAGDGDAPAKICPECQEIIAAGFHVCPVCGYEFPPPEIKLHTRHREAAILKSQVAPEWIPVDGAECFVHRKTGRPDSVRVEYRCGLVTYKEWLFPEADNERTAYFYHRWAKQAEVENPPKTTDEFVFDFEMPVPREIRVTQDGKYTKVVDRRY